MPSTRFVLALALAALSSACSTTPPEQTALMRSIDTVDVSTRELRIRMRAFAQRSGQIIQGAGGEVYYATEDHEVRRAALAWKSHAIPMFQAACFVGDPMAALIETWALAIQQTRFFDSEASRATYGEYLPIVLAACEVIEKEVEEIAESTVQSGDVSSARERIQSWADNHPIDRNGSARPSMAAQFAQSVVDDDLGALAQIGRLNQDLKDLLYRLSIYAEFLPQQGRWQAEIISEDLGIPRLVEEGRAAMSLMLEETRRAVGLLDELGSSIQRERELAFAFADEERIGMQDWLGRELQSMLDQLTAERLAVTESLTGEVEALAAQLTRERQAALLDVTALVDSRWPVMRDELPEVGRQSFEDSLPLMNTLVDRTLQRLALFGGVALVLMFLGTLVLIRVARR